MPLDPMSEDAKLIALKLTDILEEAIDEYTITDGCRPSVTADGLRYAIDGHINLNRLAVRLVQLFYGDRERSAEAAHLLAIRRDRPEDQPAAAMSPDHQ